VLWKDAHFAAQKIYTSAKKEKYGYRLFKADTHIDKYNYMWKEALIC
jgi:hypothetical protein